MTFLGISFIAGMLTVLAPCILPLLPVVLGGSVRSGGKYRALIVVGSLAVSIIAFTFLLKVSTAFVTIPSFVWSYISGGIVLLFGVTLLFPKLLDYVPGMRRANAASNQVVGSGFARDSVWGDVLIGSALGPVFSTCSPTYFLILATVLPVDFLLGSVYIAAYVLGLCTVLFLIAYFGDKVLGAFGALADPAGIFKRVLGCLFVGVGLIVITGYDKKLQTRILDAGFFDVTRVEQTLLKSIAPDETPPTQTQPEQRPSERVLPQQPEKPTMYPPEIRDAAAYLNTQEPVTFARLRDERKVVLVHIWTYSCINCKRTIPYVVDWYAKYKDKGFEVVGIHTPEFSYEKEVENVRDALAMYGITYPQVLDNNYTMFRAFNNNYWPRRYVLSRDGVIVYDHIGEGDYAKNEEVIQRELAKP